MQINPLKLLPTLVTAILIAGSVTALAADAEKPFKLEPGYVSLFNGKDLTGWGYKTNNFDGKLESSDGRYKADKGILVVTMGTGIRQLWTTKEFPKDFHLKLEFRASENADSGCFIRKPQLQVRDYPRVGPYKNLQKYKDQDWNELDITVTGDTARCLCNGEVLVEALKLPATGGIGLEADKGQMEYRRIRIKEMP